jgi:hypothetical protein
MRKGLLGVFGGWAFGAASLLAQTAEPGPVPLALLAGHETGASHSDAVVVDFKECPNGDSYQVWARGEYLLWWVKNTPLPQLVTTGSAADAFPGALGQPGTRVLYGGSGDFGANSGGRFTLGSWLDCERTIGLEASGFWLAQRSAGFSAASDPTGNPSLYVPVFRADLGREGVYRVADPVVRFNGGVAVNSQMQLWGAEANGVFNVVRGNGVSIDLLGGFRYADLTESLNVDANPFNFLNQVSDVSHDRFATRNQFYGGQVGARAEFQFGRLTFEVAGKLALGDNHEAVEIRGSTTEAGTGSPNPGTFPGGILAQPTNSGVSTRNQLTVVPEGQLKVGYQISSQLRATLGYDMLYWNQTVRPDSQIDRNVNPTQSLGAPLVGPAAPAAQFNRTDFWAQGVSFGLEFRY